MQRETRFNYLPILVSCIIVVVEVAISFNSTLLPNIKLNFAISDQLAQMTISLGLFALGLSGIVYGGLGDSFGRKPLFLFALFVFSFSSFVLSVTKSISVFLIAKFMQGIGSGAAWVVGNACLKDVFSGKDYVRVMNLVHAIAGICPAVAPVVGSYLGVVIGWRGCFQLIFAGSFVVLWIVYFFQSETLKEKKPLNLKVSAKNYAAIFSEKRFLKYLIVKVLTVMLLFSESTTIPLVFIDYMGVDPIYFGLYTLPVFLFYVGATMLSMRLSHLFKTENMILFGLYAIAGSNLLVLSLSAFWDMTPITIQMCKTLCYFGWGFIFGNATAMIVSSVPGKSGIASALMIALEMLFSSLGIYFLGFFFTGTLIPLSFFMLGTSLFCLGAMKGLGSDLETV